MGLAETICGPRVCFSSSAPLILHRHGRSGGSESVRALPDSSDVMLFRLDRVYDSLFRLCILSGPLPEKMLAPEIVLPWNSRTA
jgi:hypothetical protein